MKQNFAHIHVHNEHSYLDGFGQAKDQVAYAKKKGFKYLGLTNHGNIDGLLNFQKECLKEDIIPILGCEGYIVKDLHIKEKGEDRGHITLLVKNEVGWKNLCKLLTVANIEGFYHRARFDYELLLKHCKGLVVMTACVGSFINYKHGRNFLKKISKKTDTFIEVMPHGFSEQKKFNKLCLRLSKKLSIPIVATNDCHYISKDDCLARDVLFCINTKTKIKDLNEKYSLKGMFLRTEKQMVKAFQKQGILSEKQIKGAIKNSIVVSKKCSKFRIEKKAINLPLIPQVSDRVPSTFLAQLCHEGYEKLFPKRLKKFGTFMKDKKYYSRYREEFGIILNKGFYNYFLIVWEFVDWCRKKNITIGPGRGSVGGSLIALLLGITTNVNPIKYKLLFSRFISEDRLDLPDIDIDFAHTERGRVKKHLEDLYGAENIYGISTFSKFKSRSTIRYIGSVFEISSKEIDEFAKSIDDKNNMTLTEAFETVLGREFYDKYSDECDIALKLEGQIRGPGQHAAGVIITTDGDITKTGKGNLVKRKEDILVNWNKDEAEEMGLLKVDFLGLRNLSIIDETLRQVEQNQGKVVNLAKVKLKDKNVLKEFEEARADGVFQFGTYAMRQLMKELRPNNFNELIACVALDRPGPLNSGMVKQYIERKFGKKWKKKHPKYEKILKDTFGVVVYQEQVIRIINEVSGLPHSTADKIRKIIGKKRDVKEFEQYKKAFVKGCLKQKTLSKKDALSFWKALEKHADYSFNLAHSVEYAMIGFWTQYLKYYYPAEYTCGFLSYGNESRKKDVLKNCLQKGLEVVPPKIGISTGDKWIAKKGKLYMPFNEINGIGPATAEKLANCDYKNQHKQNSLFDSGDTCSIVLDGVNKTQRKILETIGAMPEDKRKISLDELSEYTSFSLKGFELLSYSELKKACFVNDSNLNEVICGENIRPLTTIVRRINNHKNMSTSKFCDYFGNCGRCSLRKNSYPSKSFKGLLNIAILGEFPNKLSFKKNSFMYGSKILWDELGIYKCNKSQFYKTYMCKCYTGNNKKKPTIEQVELCGSNIKKELKTINCRIVLAFGNTAMKLFQNKDKGIKQYNGQIEWSERFGCWVVYCVSPSFAKINSRNMKIFKKGVKAFGKFINKDCFNDVPF